jgi:zinc and cadmium transporter
LLGSVFSLCAGLLLLSKKLPQRAVQLWAVPFAAGALLAASFLDLIPEAFHSATEPNTIALGILIGFLFFFVLERFLGWFHHHHEHKGRTMVHPAVSLVVVGDTLHNFIDGVVIGAAFLVDPATGWVVTLAIAAHEIPQEVGDFGLLLAYGVRRRNVLLVNLFSAFVTVVAAVGVVMIGSDFESIQPIMLAVAAGFFIYIAAADIIPTIHSEAKMRIANLQTAVLVAGVIIIGVTIQASHAWGGDHDHEEADHYSLQCAPIERERLVACD